MVAGFDVIDFLHVLTDRSVQLLDVSAAGLLLADPRGELRVVAASSEAGRLLELFQLQSDQCPCLDCFRADRPVDAEDLAAAADRWPRFVPAAQQAGFAAVQALPMRLREQVIGALNLFRAAPGHMTPADKRVGHALADVAIISLLHQRSTRRSDTLNEQLQTALNSRSSSSRPRQARRAPRPDMDQAFIDGTGTLTGLAAAGQRSRCLAPGRPATSPGRVRRPRRRPCPRRSAPPPRPATTRRPGPGSGPPPGNMAAAY
jgi:GAF domain-containing protein